MSYEKELAELRKNWKKSTDKYEEAIEYGFVVDAAMRSHDVMEIERQIYVYEQATKADEYEAKNNELLEELQYLRKVNDDVVWQRDTDEEPEAKAQAIDESLESIKELERLQEEVRKVSKRNQDKAEVYKEVLFHVIREMESNLGESGEPNEL